MLKGLFFFFSKQSQTKATQTQGWEEEQQGRLFPFKIPRCFERHSKAGSAGEPAPQRGEDGWQMRLQATRQSEHQISVQLQTAVGAVVLAGGGGRASAPAPATAVAQASVPKTSFRQNPSSSA